MAGAGGAQAWSQLNGMDGDGYTIMGTNLPHTILKPMEKDVGYETDELAHVDFFHYMSDAVFVPAGSEFKTLQELVDYARPARHDDVQRLRLQLVEPSGPAAFR